MTSKQDPNYIPDLTPEQSAQIPDHIAKWQKIASCTEPADRRRAEKAIARIYKDENLAPPYVIWTGSILGNGLSRALLLPFIDNESKLRALMSKVAKATKKTVHREKFVRDMLMPMVTRRMGYFMAVADARSEAYPVPIDPDSPSNSASKATDDSEEALANVARFRSLQVHEIRRLDANGNYAKFDDE